MTAAPFAKSLDLGRMSRDLMGIAKKSGDSEDFQWTQQKDVKNWKENHSNPR